MNTDAKLCGRITDHAAHFWVGMPELSTFDREGYLNRTEWRCPGRVDIEGGQRRHHPKETS